MKLAQTLENSSVHENELQKNVWKTYLELSCVVISQQNPKLWATRHQKFQICLPNMFL